MGGNVGNGGFRMGGAGGFGGHGIGSAGGFGGHGIGSAGGLNGSQMGGVSELLSNQGSSPMRGAGAGGLRSRSMDEPRSGAYGCKGSRAGSSFGVASIEFHSQTESELEVGCESLSEGEGRIKVRVSD